MNFTVLVLSFYWLCIYVFTSYNSMFTGYEGSYGELDNQAYYVGGDGTELQYPVSISICDLIYGD